MNAANRFAALAGSARLAAAALLGGAALVSSVSTARATDWPTFDGNAARAAWLNADHSVNTRNVSTLHLKWVAKLDATADSTPIYVAHVAKHGAMLFQTDGTGKTYGIDAATGAIVWRFQPTGVRITASTPVLDPDGKHIYVPAVDGYVHKLDAATGKEVAAPGFPAQLTLDPSQEKDASPLNLANGYLYAATSGYIGDAPPYDGHVVTVNLSTGTTNVFNSLCANLPGLLSGSQCQSQRAGIWARAGVVVDPDTSLGGRVYASTGNGPFVRKQYDYGDSILALSPDGSTLMDHFTPSDATMLAQNDLDLGSTAPAMLPPIAASTTPLLAVQAGKGRELYLLNRAHIGRIDGEVQRVKLPAQVFSAPAVWQDQAGHVLIVVGMLPESQDVQAYTVTTDGSGRTRLHRAWDAAVGGTSPVVTSGLVFVGAGGVLSALDARNGKVLWQSTNSGAGGTIGGVHWQSPIVVDGAVYMSDLSGNLTAYAVT